MREFVHVKVYSTEGHIEAKEVIIYFCIIEF
jgi:hypothetical protein